MCPTPVPRRPRTIGILANSFGDPYSLRIVQGAAQELTRAGDHTLFFSGGFPQAPLFRDAEGRCALPPLVDGWVLLGETMRDSLGDLVAAARAKRSVSVGIDLPDLPVVRADAETGIFQAVMHLVKRHERRRIAFIAAPEGSTDGAQRLGAYRMAMESLGVYADPALVVVGDYEARSGREAVRQLKRQAGSFDAIVAANDLMALGALEGLRAAGKRVPEDVSVVGYDDIEDASFASPGLTTVRQPLVDLGYSGARLALRRGQPGASAEEEREVVATPLVIRESCGCQSDEDDRRSVPPAAESTRTRGLFAEALRDLVRRELANARLYRELERLMENIVRATDFPALARAMPNVIELLGLKRFLLCTYAGGQRHARATIESSGRDVVFHHQTQPFPVEQILPQAFLRSEKPLQLAIEPLEFADEQFGYFVLEGELRYGLAYLTLRRYLGCTVARMAHGRELRRLYAAEKRRAEVER
jgi:DNA-binding LacI/PurR family transcriptional regulator